MKPIKVIVEKHPDGYIAYPLGLKGVIVGQGDTYEATMADVRSAISFHVETFGPEVLEIAPPVLEAFIAEAAIVQETRRGLLDEIINQQDPEPIKEIGHASKKGANR